MITKLVNIFSEQELELLWTNVNQTNPVSDNSLGREVRQIDSTFPEIYEKLIRVTNEIYGPNLSVSSITYVEYNNKFGTPNLPPHFDADTSDLIFNFQLSSNTKWDIGLDMSLYSLEDNSAVLFNSNEVIHWRPIKQFKDEEYIKMLFFRFEKPDRTSYSHLDYTLDHEIYREVNKFRDSLNEA